MLVLSRKKNESIVVDGPAVIRVLSVRGDKVRIGVTADESVAVDRAEVVLRRLAERNAIEQLTEG